jgi:hypothetical protein
MRAERIGLLAAALVVAGGLVGGVALIGSPAHQRDLELDRRRAGDLAEVAAALQQRFHPGDDRTQVPLPAALPPDLVVQYLNRAVETTDPRDHRPYVYVRESPTRYRLCATFALPSADDGGYRPGWPHGAGLHCYRFDLTGGAEPRAASS